MKKILVVGGGIGGPAFCLFCKKFGVDAQVTLAERAPEFKDVGYGISLWGNGRKILDQLELVKNIDDKKGYEIPWDTIETPTHRILNSFYFNISKTFGRPVSIGRTALQIGLVSAMQKENLDVRLNSPVKIISNGPEGVMAQLGDNQPEHFDLAVAADGLRSATRETIFGPGKLKYLGIAYWAFWVPEGFSHPKGLIQAIRDGKTVLSAPVGERACIVLTAKNHPSEIEPPEQRKEMLLKTFSGFEPDILNMIRAIDRPETIMRDNVAHIEMDEWYKDRVVLTGDAQHALSLITGMGASLALEDAMVLAEELKKVNDIAATLKEFAIRRGSRVRVLKKLSSMLEFWLYATGPLSIVRDWVLGIVPASLFTNELVHFLSQEI